MGKTEKGLPSSFVQGLWIPACAGMTKKGSFGFRYSLVIAPMWSQLRRRLK